MKKQLDAQGLNFELFEAYDGKLIPEDFIDKHADREAIVLRQMPPGAIGCSFSHIFIYKLIAERNDEVALILEDDMKLSKDFARIVQQAAQHVQDGDIVFPYFIPKPNCKLTSDGEVKLEGRYSIKSFVDYHRALATGAYLLTKNTAKKMYEGLLPMSTYADDWSLFYEKGLVKRYKTIYPLVSRAADFRSEIGYLRDKPKIKKIVNFIQDKTPLLNWFFKLYRRRVANKLRNQIVLTNEKAM